MIAKLLWDSKDLAMIETSKKIQIAVVGAGPSGFYTAEALINTGLDVEITIIEKLPCPYGLVRYGVAPDHQKLKSVTATLDVIAEHPNVHYLGNVTLGKEITLDELKSLFNAVVFTTGMPNGANLDIPGEDLSGVHPATSFIGWYNGHPDFQNTEFDFSASDAVIIGHGNVAVDVGRILSKSIDELRKSDITEQALQQLSESKIKNIRLVGRRGPVQAKFTSREIHELGKLENCLVKVHPVHLDLNLASHIELEEVSNSIGKKNYSIFQDYSKNFESSGALKEIHIDFMMSPKAFIGKKKLQAVSFDVVNLTGPAFNQLTENTGQVIHLDAGLAFSCVGFRGVPFNGLATDTKNGTLQNIDSRLIDNEGNRISGLYAAGWVKRGPRGVVGTNKECAQHTVNQMMADIDKISKRKRPGYPALAHLLFERYVQYVTFKDWKIIDFQEIERGKLLGKPREKFTSVNEMLACI